MKYEEIKFGMKVVPISKSIAFGKIGLQYSYSWQKAKEMKQPYLFVSGIVGRDDSKVILCSDMPIPKSEKYTDFFYPEDLIPYDEIIEGENK